MRVSGRVAATLVMAFLVVALVPVVSQGDDDMVAVGRPGVLFHKVGSKDIRGHAYGKSVSEAVAAGYAPCPICFAKSASFASLRPAGGGMFTASPGFLRNGVIVSPGQRNLTPLSQPFGLRPGALHGGGLAKGAVPDPYVLNQTHRINPVLEQGAYGPHGSH